MSQKEQNFNDEYQPIPANGSQFDGMQISKSIYLKNMNAMKHILIFGEAQWGGRESPTYKYFKKVVMDETYNGMTAIFEDLSEKGIVRKCDCGSYLRNGYNKRCNTCSGAGYCNTDDYNDFFGDIVYDGNVVE